MSFLLAGAGARGQIILDTDSGAFADDGVAVTMLLRSPRRGDLRGITVVSGNVWSRDGAGFMSRNARLLGVPDLPVLGKVRTLRNNLIDSLMKSFHLIIIFHLMIITAQLQCMIAV